MMTGDIKLSRFLGITPRRTAIDRRTFKVDNPLHLYHVELHRWS
jgi:hypothetical protein